jgi:hypothetical protein
MDWLCDDGATNRGLWGRPVDMSLTVLSMFDTIFLYFSITIDCSCGTRSRCSSYFFAVT